MSLYIDICVYVLCIYMCVPLYCDSFNCDEGVEKRQRKKKHVLLTTKIIYIYIKIVLRMSRAP